MDVLEDNWSTLNAGDSFIGDAVDGWELEGRGGGEGGGERGGDSLSSKSCSYHVLRQDLLSKWFSFHDFRATF